MRNILFFNYFNVFSESTSGKTGTYVFSGQAVSYVKNINRYGGNASFVELHEVGAYGQQPFSDAGFEGATNGPDAPNGWTSNAEIE